MPTGQGGAWHAATVRRIAMREAERDEEVALIEHSGIEYEDA